MILTEYIVINGARVPLPILAQNQKDAEARLQNIMTALDVRHFKSHEFAPFPEELEILIPGILLADEIRHVFGDPVKIISGLRVPANNGGEGQSPTSQHLWGRAADLKPINGDVQGLYAAALVVIDGRIRGRGWSDNRRYGLGRYDTFVHVDEGSADMPGGRSQDSRWGDK